MGAQSAVLAEALEVLQAATSFSTKKARDQHASAVRTLRAAMAQHLANHGEASPERQALDLLAGLHPCLTTENGPLAEAMAIFEAVTETRAALERRIGELGDHLDFAHRFYRGNAGALPRAIGVSRDTESPGQRSVLVAFERQLSDDELRSLHELLRGLQVLDANSGRAKEDPHERQDRVSRLR